MVGTHIIWWRQTIEGGDTHYSKGTDNMQWGHTIIFLLHKYVRVGQFGLPFVKYPQSDADACYNLESNSELV